MKYVSCSHLSTMYLTKLVHAVELKRLVFKIPKADCFFQVAARIFKKLTKRQ